MIPGIIASGSIERDQSGELFEEGRRFVTVEYYGSPDGDGDQVTVRLYTRMAGVSLSDSLPLNFLAEGQQLSSGFPVGDTNYATGRIAVVDFFLVSDAEIGSFSSSGIFLLGAAGTSLVERDRLYSSEIDDGFQSFPRACAIDPSGRYLAVSVGTQIGSSVGPYTERVDIYDISGDTLSLVSTFSTGSAPEEGPQPDSVSTLAFSPDGTAIAFGYFQQGLVLHRFSGGNISAGRTLIGGAEVRALHFRDDQRFLAALVDSSEVRTFEISDSSAYDANYDPFVNTGVNSLGNLEWANPRGSVLPRFCIVGDSGEVKLLRKLQGTPQFEDRPVTGAIDFAYSCAYSPGGKFVVFAGYSDFGSAGVEMYNNYSSGFLYPAPGGVPAPRGGADDFYDTNVIGWVA